MYSLDKICGDNLYKFQIINHPALLRKQKPNLGNNHHNYVKLSDDNYVTNKSYLSEVS